MIKNILLGFLYDCTLTGYEIKKMVENGMGIFYRTSYGSIYPALKKLEEQGLVTMASSTENERNKKAYTITNEGKSAFMEWLAQPVDFEQTDSRQLAKIYFYDKLPLEKRTKLLQDFEEYHQNYLRKLQNLQAKLDTPQNQQEHYFKLSTLYYGLCITKATIGWCQMITKRGHPLVD